MIEILTLMLGIIVGSSEVELRVDVAVARVEVRLDREAVLDVTAPPWRVEIEWGDDILPHVLEVIAYDADGEELGRDSRWINLRASDSVARLVLPRPDAEGRVRYVDVRWASVGVERPRAVTASLGDRALDVDTKGRIQLPAYDPKRLHWLSVEVDFGKVGKEVLGASLGGETLVELSTQLTAVPMEIESRRAAAKLEGRVTLEGRPVAIHTVEKGAAEVVMVIDRGAIQHMTRLIEEGSMTGLNGALMMQRVRGSRGVEWAIETDLKAFGRLDPDTALRFVWPQAASWSGPRLSPDMFLSSPARPLSEVGLLAATHRGESPRRQSKLAAAVAIAGLSAATGSRRRAVVLIARELQLAHSRDVEKVVSYLAALRVPLYIWSVGEEASDGPWPMPRHLGGLEPISRARASLGDAIEDLRKSLDDQRMVWLEGQYLPQRLTLDPSLKGVSWPTGTGGG